MVVQQDSHAVHQAARDWGQWGSLEWRANTLRLGLVRARRVETLWALAWWRKRVLVGPTLPRSLKDSPPATSHQDPIKYQGPGLDLAWPCLDQDWGLVLLCTSGAIEHIKYFLLLYFPEKEDD